MGRIGTACRNCRLHSIHSTSESVDPVRTAKPVLLYIPNYRPVFGIVGDAVAYAFPGLCAVVKGVTGLPRNSREPVPAAGPRRGALYFSWGTQQSPKSTGINVISYSHSSSGIHPCG